MEFNAAPPQFKVQRPSASSTLLRRSSKFKVQRDSAAVQVSSFSLQPSAFVLRPSTFPFRRKAQNPSRTFDGPRLP